MPNPCKKVSSFGSPAGIGPCPAAAAGAPCVDPGAKPIESPRDGGLGDVCGAHFNARDSSGNWVRAGLWSSVSATADASGCSTMPRFLSDLAGSSRCCAALARLGPLSVTGQLRSK